MVDKASNILDEFYFKFFGDISQYIDHAKLQGIEQAMRIAAIIGNNAPPEGFANLITQEYNKTYGAVFNNSNAQFRIEKWVKSIYEYYRFKDPYLFPKNINHPDPKSIPISQHLALADKRTKDFISSGGYVDLGKYITDKDAQKRIKAGLVEQYIDKGKSIGNSPKEIQEFREKFSELIDLQDYQIRRIIDTSTSSSRNYAHIRTLQQIGAEEYEIAGPKDKMTCEWCSSMVGRKFSVKKSAVHVDTLIEGGLNYRPESKPFLTSKFSSEEINEASNEEISGMRCELPPYHCSCRHRIVLSKVSFSESESSGVESEDTGNNDLHNDEGIIDNKYFYKTQATVNDCQQWADKHYPDIKWDFQGINNVEVSNQILDQFVKLANGFPDVANNLSFVGVTDKNNFDGKEVLAKYVEKIGKIEFNKEKLKDVKKLMEALKNDVKSNFHPNGCDTIESLLTHEFGHSFMDYINQNPDLAVLPFVNDDGEGFAKNILSRWLDVHVQKAYKQKEISRYAYKEYKKNQVTGKKEYFGEGFALLNHGNYKNIKFANELKTLLKTINPRKLLTRDQYKWFNELNNNEKEKAEKTISDFYEKLGISRK